MFKSLHFLNDTTGTGQFINTCNDLHVFVFVFPFLLVGFNTCLIYRMKDTLQNRTSLSMNIHWHLDRYERLQWSHGNYHNGEQCYHSTALDVYKSNIHSIRKNKHPNGVWLKRQSVEHWSRYESPPDHWRAYLSKYWFEEANGGRFQIYSSRKANRIRYVGKGRWRKKIMVREISSLSFSLEEGESLEGGRGVSGVAFVETSARELSSVSSAVKEVWGRVRGDMGNGWREEGEVVVEVLRMGVVLDSG